MNRCEHCGAEEVHTLRLQDRQGIRERIGPSAADTLQDLAGKVLCLTCWDIEVQPVMYGANEHFLNTGEWE